MQEYYYKNLCWNYIKVEFLEDEQLSRYLYLEHEYL